MELLMVILWAILAIQQTAILIKVLKIEEMFQELKRHESQYWGGMMGHLEDDRTKEETGYRDERRFGYEEEDGERR